MKIGIIGDFDSSFVPHAATNEAMGHSSQALGIEMAWEWIPTQKAEAQFEEVIQHYNGFWIAPGSPYRSMKGALQIIEFARLNHYPLLGTCGGFQHIVIEFARNVLAIEDAEHAEYDPYASKLVINQLVCSLAGKSLEIILPFESSKTYQVYQSAKVVEQYYCNFGLNPIYQEALSEHGLFSAGIDESGETRILELKNHPFFIGTLFVPQTLSTPAHPHPLINEFIRQVSASPHP